MSLPKKTLDEEACRRELTTYKVFSIHRVSSPDSKRSNWAKSEIVPENVSGHQIIEHLKNVENGKLVLCKKLGLNTLLQLQITSLLEALSTDETGPNFEWSLVDLQKHRKWWRFTILLVYCMRSPKMDVNPILLHQNIQRNQQERFGAPNRLLAQMPAPGAAGHGAGGRPPGNTFEHLRGQIKGGREGGKGFTPHDSRKPALHIDSEDMSSTSSSPDFMDSSATSSSGTEFTKSMAQVSRARRYRLGPIFPIMSGAPIIPGEEARYGPSTLLQGQKSSISDALASPASPAIKPDPVITDEHKEGVEGLDIVKELLRQWTPVEAGNPTDDSPFNHEENDRTEFQIPPQNEAPLRTTSTALDEGESSGGADMHLGDERLAPNHFSD